MSDAPERITKAEALKVFAVDYAGSEGENVHLTQALFDAADRIEELEAELREARMQSLSDLGRRIDAALAALKGQDDE